MIITVGGIKGGTGKSTIATNLATCAASQNRKVLLVDADQQRSVSDWADQRHANENVPMIATISLLGRAVHQTILEMSRDYDFCIIDTGGRETMTQRSVLTVSDKFLIPFKPRSFDIWTIGAVKNLIDEVKIINEHLECFSIINQGDVRGKDNEEALEILAEMPSLINIPTVLHHRKIYSNAAANGLGVIEIPNTDRKAFDEVTALFNFITLPCKKYAENT